MSLMSLYMFKVLLFRPLPRWVSSLGRSNSIIKLNFLLMPEERTGLLLTLGSSPQAGVIVSFFQLYLYRFQKHASTLSSAFSPCEVMIIADYLNETTRHSEVGHFRSQEDFSILCIFIRNKRSLLYAYRVKVWSTNSPIC